MCTCVTCQLPSPEYAATPCDERLEDEYCEVHDEYGCRFGREDAE